MKIVYRGIFISRAFIFSYLLYFIWSFLPISVAERRRMQFSLMMKGAELFYGSSFTWSCTTTPRCSQGLCTCSSSTSAREQKFCKHSNRYGWAECYPRKLNAGSLPKGCSATQIAVCCMTVLFPQRPSISRLLRPYVLVYVIVLCPPEIVISGTASIRESVFPWWASHRDPSGTEPVPHVWQAVSPCQQWDFFVLRTT